MKVKFELTRYIPQWKATLEGRPASTKETVEVEVWEHNTRGLEPLGQAFAGLISTRIGSVESGKTLFVRPPKYKDNPLLGSQEYYPTKLSLRLPTLGEDDDAQKIADEYFALIRQVYREGCELASKIAKTLLELPEEAWDAPFEVKQPYADPVRVRWFERANGFTAAEQKLGMPDRYLSREPVIEAFKKHKKLEAHIQGIWERRQAEHAEAAAVARQQHNERKAEIEKVHEANRQKFEAMFLSTCTDADKERYERGFVSEAEMKDRVREILFGRFDGQGYYRMSASYVCEECAEAMFGVIDGPSLNAEQFADLKRVEAFFTDPEFTLKIREHWGRCECSENEVSQVTVLVTWKLPGVDPLSREYEIGFAVRS